MLTVWGVRTAGVALALTRHETALCTAWFYLSRTCGPPMLSGVSLSAVVVNTVIIW